MSTHIGNRYMLKEAIVPAGGLIYNAVDRSLQRDVIIYLINKESGEDSEQIMRVLGKVSRFTDPRFMHILDIGLDERRIYAVLKKNNGQPLLRGLKHHSFKLNEILQHIYELGKGLLEALEEGIGNFSVTAENIWLTDKGGLMVIDYWTEGEAARRGVKGLGGLLYQLCTRSHMIPVNEELFTKNLRASLDDLTAHQADALLLIARQAFQEQLSLSSFMMHLHDLLRDMRPEEKASQTDYRHVATDKEPEPRYRGNSTDKEPPSRYRHVPDDEEDEELYDEDSDEFDDSESATLLQKIKDKRLWAAISLICLAVVAGCVFRGWLQSGNTENADAPPAVTKERTGQDTLPAEQPDHDAAPADHSDSEDGQETNPQSTDHADTGERLSGETDISGDQGSVMVPALIGLTREEAEKSALSAGLHYEFFLEFNEQEQGTVFKQEPEAGTQVPKGGKVTFWVSKGPR